jgi:hypothetical protein
MDYIEVLVGKHRKSFSVHKNIVCARSPFFAAACSERWIESKSKSIELPEDDPDVFDIYLHCVYTNCVDVGDTEEALESEDGFDEHERECLRLLNTYILADKVGDVITSNMVIDEIILMSEETDLLPSSKVTGIAASTAPPETPIYQLYLDFYVYEAGVSAIQTFKRGYVPEAFMLSVLEEKTKLSEDNRTVKIEDVFEYGFTTNHKCRYHRHDNEHPRCGDGCEKVKDDKHSIKGKEGGIQNK